MIAPALRLARVLATGALLIAFATSPGVLAEGLEFPPATAGDDKHLVENAHAEAERFHDRAIEFLDAYVRNFKECMFEENPDCGLPPVLP